MTIADIRTLLTTALTEAGITAHGYVPERPAAPAAIVQPAWPYLTPGPTFGTATVHYVVSLIVSGVATNATTTRELDELIEKAVEAVSDEFDVDQAGGFYAYNAAGTPYLACDLTISTPTT